MSEFFSRKETLYNGECVSLYSLGMGVLCLELNRPELRNAFNTSMIEELTVALTQAIAIPDESEFRVLVLKGNGKVFCAGADIDYMKEQSQKNLAQNLIDAKQLGAFFYRLASFPTPVIAAVHGAAIGGGFGLAACADFVVAMENTVFATSEVQLGIVPGVISPYVVRKMGPAAAGYCMLTGKRFLAPELHKFGLVQHVVTVEQDWWTEVSKVTLEFLRAAPNAARRTKQLILKASPLPTPALFEFSARSIAEARSSDEGKNGISCFLSKQPLPWNQQVDDILTNRNKI